ncbi:hypothetical protein [Kitasatospora sp. NBC_00458]|uniref:hypothetical protein n=1 Tax=Kitasatospora sp. NBC_00458 TaxID=2903568 RepID=UPI002E189E9B
MTRAEGGDGGRFPLDEVLELDDVLDDVLDEEPGGGPGEEGEDGEDVIPLLDREEDAPRDAAGRVGWLSCLAFVVAVVTLVAGGVVWVLWDDLYYPFGDSRACEGSDAVLSGVISDGGVRIPEDASDVHYFTRNGVATVSFLSGQVPDYLHRAGVIPESKPLFDRAYGSPYGMVRGESEPPDELCGPALREPAWSYWNRGTGTGVGVLVERSPAGGAAFRTPARVIVSFGIG